MKKIALILGWFAVTSLLLTITLSTYQTISQIPQKAQRPNLEYSPNFVNSEAVLPETLGSFTYSVKSEDAIPEIIRQYLEKYHSPLLPYTDHLVRTARHYGLDPRLLVAIAQQESNLCKKIPADSHNCWGWGIHSRGTLRFDSYPEAIDAVTKGLARNYFKQGLITPEDIMGIYTPLSSGSWAKGVQQFLDDMD